MPRYYRRRYTRVVAAPKKKWASNIMTFANTPSTAAQYFTLVENKSQTGSPTPVIVKAGNFKVSVDAILKFPDAISTNPVAMVFIMYVPESWPNGDMASIVTSHPEWIMVTKTVGGSFPDNAKDTMSLETLNMSSRLKRNLNSGDRIVMYFTFSAAQVESIQLTGTVRYWTCAN